jgi:hypothetical protein
MISPEKIAAIITRVEATMCTTYSSGWTDGREEARITKEDWETILSELLTLRAERDEVGDSRNDDIAAASILYQCADCLRAGAEYSCFNATDVFIIRKEVICRDCADAGHAGEQRRAVPNIAVKIKRQRMHATAQQRRAEAAEAQLARQGEAIRAAEAFNEAAGDPADTLHHGRDVLAVLRSTLSPEDSQP